MVLERDADRVAQCFLLERELFEEGFDRVFDGEVTGLVGSGAFVRFGEPGGPGDARGVPARPPHPGRLVGAQRAGHDPAQRRGRRDPHGGPGERPGRARRGAARARRPRTGGSRRPESGKIGADAPGHRSCSCSSCCSCCRRPRAPPSVRPCPPGGVACRRVRRRRAVHARRRRRRRRRGRHRARGVRHVRPHDDARRHRRRPRDRGRVGRGAAAAAVERLAGRERRRCCPAPARRCAACAITGALNTAAVLVRADAPGANATLERLQVRVTGDGSTGVALRDGDAARLDGDRDRRGRRSRRSPPGRSPAARSSPRAPARARSTLPTLFFGADAAATVRNTILRGGVGGWDAVGLRQRRRARRPPRPLDIAASTYGAGRLRTIRHRRLRDRHRGRRQHHDRRPAARRPARRPGPPPAARLAHDRRRDRRSGAAGGDRHRRGSARLRRGHRHRRRRVPAAAARDDPDDRRGRHRRRDQRPRDAARLGHDLAHRGRPDDRVRRDRVRRDRHREVRRRRSP